MILDVGPGGTRLGDVAIDLYADTTPQDSGTGELTPLDRGPYFIQANAEHLPLRTNSFDGVFCYHVLEHLKHPLQALKELARVSRGFIQIEVPHRYSKVARMPYHINYFDMHYFTRIATLLNLTMIRPIVSLDWYNFPSFTRNINVTYRVRK